MIGSPGTNWLATKVRTTAVSRTGKSPSTRRSAYVLTRPHIPREPAASDGRPQLSLTVLNGRNRNGVRCTPCTFGFRSAICIRTTRGTCPSR